MKVLFLTPWYPDENSPNSGIFIRSQAVALLNDHEVVVISSKISYSKFSFCSFSIDESIHRNLKEYRIVVNRSLPLYNQINHLLITFIVTKRIIKNFRPDIVHSSIGYPGGIWGWFISRSVKSPFVFTEHTRIVNNFRSVFHKVLTIFSLKRTSACLAVGKSLANEMELYLNRSVQVIPNVVEVDRFRIRKPEQHQITQIGFLGGMNTNIKGLDILLIALADIKSDFVFHIGGDGKLKNDLIDQATQLGMIDKCKFYGYIPLDDVPDFMTSLDFLVCSSRYETFNVSLVEAMASGLPVVSTRCGGPQDFVNEVNGVLVDVNDVSALQIGIEWMISNHLSFDSNKIRNFAVDNFSPEMFRKKMNTLYENLVSSARN